MPSQIKALATGLALLASAVLGHPPQKRMPILKFITNPVSHAMTAWGENIHVYYVDAATKYIREVCNNGLAFKESSQAWKTCTTPALPDFRAADDGVMSVINTYNTTIPGIEVYAFDISNNLFVLEYRESGANAGWRATSIRSLPKRRIGTPIRAVTWNIGDVIYRSIFYYDDKGMKELTKGNENNLWIEAPVGLGGTPLDFTATVTVEPAPGGNPGVLIEKSIWTIGAKAMQWRHYSGTVRPSNVNSNWNLPWSVVNQPSWGVSSSMAMFQISPSNWRFYFNNGNKTIFEITAKTQRLPTNYNLDIAWQDTNDGLGRGVGIDSKISAVTLNKNSTAMTYILHKDDEGALAFTWNNGAIWSSGSPTITLLA